MNSREFQRELPLAPVRHRQVMDKLARCRFCDRLTCCMKHLLEHESRHSALKEESQKEREGNSSSEPSGWVDATEAVLASSRKKIKFPLFCIYCKITVKDEYNLRCLMTNGPRCPTKESHWIVSLKQYHEKIINSQLLLVLEESVAKTPSVKITDKGLQSDCPLTYKSRISLYSQNRNIAGVQSYSITPQGDNFTFPQVTPRDTSLHSIRKMQSFSTSTPQDGSAPNNLEIDLSLSHAQTPVCEKNASAPQGILSSVKNDQKPKGDSARKVTFSITKTKEDISNDKCDENDGEKNKTHKNENDSNQRSEGKNDDGSFIGTKVGDEENKKELVDTHKECSKQSQDENSQQRIGENKLEDQSIIKVVVSGENKQCDEFSDNFDVLKDLDKKAELIDKCELGTEKEESKTEKKQENTLGGERVEKMMHGENEQKSKNDENIILFSADDKLSLAEKDQDKQNKINDMQTCSDKEVSNESSSQTFFSGEESDDARYELESTSFLESSGGDSKESLVSSTETDLRGYYKTGKDSQRLSSVPDEVSEKPKFRKTLSSSFSFETKDNSENEPPTELNFEKTQASFKEDNLHYSFQDSEESSHSYLLHSDSCEEKDLPCDKSEQINVSNTEQEWSFTKIATALSFSWNKAKKLVMQSWGTKRENLDNSEDNTNDAPPKRIKLSHSCSCSDHDTHTLPVQWRCSQKPIRTYDYNIKSRRPLPRMGKK